MRNQAAERLLWVILGKWNKSSIEASKLQFLKNLPFFQDLADWQLKRVSEVVFERHYDENETLFEQGQPGAALFLIWEGNVAIELDHVERKTTIAHLDKGHFLGEMALIDESARSATARATVPTKTLALYRNDLKRLALSDPGTACSIYRALAGIVGDRLRSTNDLLRVNTDSAVGAPNVDSAPSGRTLEHKKSAA
jgi:CRP/FNR family transcriptional regulator, cyclic AMP receptor protein